MRGQNSIEALLKDVKVSDDRDTEFALLDEGYQTEKK